MIDLHHVGQFDGVIKARSWSPLVMFINDARRGRDEVEIELALQPFLDNLHMQEPQEPAAETKAQSLRRFPSRNCSEASFSAVSQRIPKLFEIAGIRRDRTQNTIGMDGLKPGRASRTVFIVRDRIADLRSEMSLIAAVMKPISPGPSCVSKTFSWA
jgi:hypothetical protein